MRRFAITVIALALLGMTSGCGEDEPSTSSDEPVVIDITFEGDSVDPAGERVSVKVDQPVELVVKADSAGEIHVHSNPEQQFSYSEGTTTLPLTINRPGLVEVESHDLEKVIVQLEVE